MVGKFILYLALLQLGAVTAVTAAVVGVVVLIYRSIPNWNPEICGAGDKKSQQKKLLKKSRTTLVGWRTYGVDGKDGCRGSSLGMIN